ncbi:unnamed protein product [Soboliphyme baturini]|uniref:SRP9-21 domain-containing protein n=1 Tax=Soboliphyme baturini TaxID=241478 RepID=A0A183J3V3_9BILA|nr:unnamed protein product [Soboliphyme baturini]
MSSDWSTYLADFGKEDGRYIRVQPTTAVCVLEKVYEHEKRKGTLFGKSKDKDRKKLLDTILKQLKSHVNGSGAS